MFISKTSKYAIKLLSYMAMFSEDSFRSKELCDELKIPYKYLSAIITTLSKAGIISSTKGRNGGIRFAKDIKDITLYEIIKITESTTLEECIMGFGSCDEEEKCLLHDSWKVPKSEIIDTFLSQTLLDIVTSS